MPNNSRKHGCAKSASHRPFMDKPEKAKQSIQDPGFKLRRRFLKYGIIAGTPIAFLLVLELFLRVINSGYPIEFFAKTEDGKYLIPNPTFARRFFPPDVVKEAWPFKIPVKKEKDTIRIFVLGDSAAQGTPAPAFGFSRILDRLISYQYPHHKFEIVNAAMRGINSHVIVPIAKECAQYEADFILVYAGNNETVGLYAPESGKFNIVKYPMLIELKHLLIQTKVGQFIDEKLLKVGGKKERETQDVEYFKRHRISFNNPLRIATIRNFENNLSRICENATCNGARVLLSTIAVNLQDFPPLGSLHREGLNDVSLQKWEKLVQEGDEMAKNGNFDVAIQLYEKALEIDAEYAELHYKIAECYRAVGKNELAKKHYRLACDYDTLPFRADSRINQIIRKTAEKFRDKGVYLVDADVEFEKNASQTECLPGARYFHEHVHFRFSGDYLLARSFLEKLSHLLLSVKSIEPAKPDTLSEKECALRLAFTEWDELDTTAAMVRLTAKPLFQCQLDHTRRQATAERALAERLKKFTNVDFKKSLDVYAVALALYPDDWMIHFNYGNILSVAKDYENAAKHYQIVLEKMPFFKQTSLLLQETLNQLTAQNKPLRNSGAILR